MKSFQNSALENKKFDVIVVGAGHAGCEAALASARLGLKTVVFTVSVDSIALMPCNPNIGGTSKGHLVREIDALGGEMAKNIDKTFIQSKMLNKSKGPAVHSLRAQADKADYSRAMRKTMEEQDNLTIKQAEVTEIIVNKGVCEGVKVISGATYYAKAVVLATGVYLNARCIYGEVVNHTGPNGLMAATHLTKSLENSGIDTRRFKTGTPARVDGRTIDYSKMEEQFGDTPIIPFSFSSDREKIQKPQVSCFLTYTNKETHKIIKENIHRSPLFSGAIEGTGPRYCPSIEDKVVKFADKDRHQVFIEPEGLHTHEMYLSGMSSSLPEDVQDAMYHSVPGLEHAEIVRNAYAIEYDCIDARKLKASLEFKDISGLFAAGQFNGSSGYEEAAAQGLVAGINAAMKVKNEEPLVLDRSQAYIGVLIDDLVTKESHEPYRMMTSRAEYRLLLRQDNADLRLRKIGYEIGLVSKSDYDKLLEKENLIKKEVERLKKTTIGAKENVQAYLKSKNSTLLSHGITLAELLCRPEIDYESLFEIDKEREVLPVDVKEQVEIEIKYEGYILRQAKQVEHFKKLESKKIPADLDYDKVGSLRIEARQKLKDIKPESIGQASRISGVSPADIAVLLVYMQQWGEKEKDKNRTNVRRAIFMKVFDVEKFNLMLKKMGINANEDALSRFELYYYFLITENEKMNLTAITDPEEVMIKHFVDSVALLKFIDIKGSLIDIGTGAGFPGIPLKILNPDLKLTLLDSLDKRISFLDKLCEKLELDDVETIHGRAEELARDEKYREKFDYASSRAVAKLSILNEYALPFLKVGGRFFSYKSDLVGDELSYSRKSLELLGGKLTQDFSVTLPNSKIIRRFLIIEKTLKTSDKYPRRAGIPSKRPL